MKQTINIPDNLEVTFTSQEILEFIAVLQKGSFEFVEPVILPIKERLIQTYNESQSDPIGGGGGAGAPKPKPNE